MHSRFAGMFTVFILFSIAFSQEQKINSSKTTSEDEYKIKVDVEEVRLDAVALDKNGRQISDLKAEDFEILQDSLPQKILSCSYITNNADPAAQPAVYAKTSKGIPSIPAPILERNQVNRTIVFVVDDASMFIEEGDNDATLKVDDADPGTFTRGFRYVNFARMALRGFVEKQMMPGDLIAILRTRDGVSKFQTFVSDQQDLLKRIEKIRWGFGFKRYDADPRILFKSQYDDANMPQGGDEEMRLRDDSSQYDAIRYSLRALKDMPGRKSLVLISRFPVNFGATYLAEEALRAGVVIHAMTVGALEAPNPNLVIRDLPRGKSGANSEEQQNQINAFILSRAISQANKEYNSLDKSDALASRASRLSDLTGGIKLTGNFFVNPENKVNEAMKGYYLLSYTPPAGTFGEIQKYHQIRIRAKRPGVEVHSRKGFTGVPESEEHANVDPLWTAIYSPFKNSDLQVGLSSGYIHDPQKGYLLRSWLHLNPEELTLVKKENEGYIVSIEIVCITSDIDGFVQDSTNYQYQFRIKEENLQWVKDHGIRFSLFLPVKKPGNYYVRAVVKDPVSGKVGSSYQAVQIPDLKKGSMTLSDIFVVNNGDNVSWMKSGSAEGISQKQIEPILQRDASRSPALREYAPGDSFEYAAMVYNAKNKTNQSSGLEQQVILYKDGEEFMRTEAKPIAVDNGVDSNRILIREKLALDEKYQEGDYVLQLLVRDKQSKEKNAVTAVTYNFRVLTK